MLQTNKIPQFRGAMPAAVAPLLQDRGCLRIVSGERAFALMTEAVRRLRAMAWEAPEQDLSLPGNAFPPWPRDGMRISVAPALAGGPG